MGEGDDDDDDDATAGDAADDDDEDDVNADCGMCTVHVNVDAAG
jgi:hypothetical protein